MHVHLDGARIFNACAELKIDPKELVKNCDSVMFCLSKGLCTPIGSIVAGSREFIAKFNKNRKMLGGILRKPGIVAEMGIYALNTIRHELGEDNEAARKLGGRLLSLGWVEIT
jgi:threonine aldolase